MLKLWTGLCSDCIPAQDIAWCWWRGKSWATSTRAAPKAVTLSPSQELDAVCSFPGLFSLAFVMVKRLSKICLSAPIFRSLKWISWRNKLAWHNSWYGSWWDESEKLFLFLQPLWLTSVTNRSTAALRMLWARTRPHTCTRNLVPWEYQAVLPASVLDLA